MKYIAKYFQTYNINKDYYENINLIQKRSQQTLNVKELCSIPNNKDNYSLLENTISSNIISKGFFQTEAQKALQNSQIEKAFEIAEIGRAHV